MIAAQSIGEPGTQLTCVRSRWWCGVCAAASTVESKIAGQVGFALGLRYVTNAKGECIAISRSGEALFMMIIVERERHKIPRCHHCGQ